MLVKIILNYILGYLNITVEGFFIERFINICSRKKIYLWNLKKVNSSVINVNISIKDFKKIKGVCKKTNCTVHIKNKKGLPFSFYKYKKRKIFLILLLNVIAVTIISSMYIWNIEVVGTNSIDKNELLEIHKMDYGWADIPKVYIISALTSAKLSYYEKDHTSIKFSFTKQ